MTDIQNVGIWVRVSTQLDSQKTSNENHLERAKHYAKSRNWNVAKVYRLDGVSGKSILAQKKAKEMMRDVESGEIQGLIFSKIARLARNTKELLEFADFFKLHNASMISLDESIDTSTPVGRLFYTVISAMAQWEREETSARIKASVESRARQGKNTGGHASFGYSWVEGKLQINEKEAPVLKLMFELFSKYKRKRTVARLLNERGYRTRRGAKFSDTTVLRLLMNPISKGLRRANYTYEDENGRMQLKSTDEWIMHEAPAIVSTDLWDEVNDFLENRRKNWKPVSKRTLHLFTGFLYCHCGHKMYVLSNSKKYVCEECKNKIVVEDIEEIFHEELKDFVFSEEQIKKYYGDQENTLTDKKELLKSLQKSYSEIENKLNKTMELYQKGEIPIEAFKSHYDPDYDQKLQIEGRIPKIQADIDYLNINLSSNEYLLKTARDLYSNWKLIEREDQRIIIENIVEKITVSTDEIVIRLNDILATSSPPNQSTNSLETNASTSSSNSSQIGNDKRVSHCFCKPCRLFLLF